MNSRRCLEAQADADIKKGGNAQQNQAIARTKRRRPG
jgi:hypothetical protein